MRFITLSERPFAVVRRFILLAGLCGLLRPAPAAAQTDLRFGAMTHFAQGANPAWAATVAQLGITTVRDELYWNQVEPTRGVYAFPAEFDTYMAALKQNAISPFIILDFENQNYDSDYTPYDADGFTGYANYANAVLQHYGSQIQAVEIWNEYNGTWCTGPATNDRPGTYTQMLQQAYARIKAARPDVTVAGGATAGIALSYWQQLMQDGALPYMDVLSVHPYRYNSPPEGIENDINSLQALVKQYNNGVTKPIWVSEIGWQIQAGSSTALAIDETTQAEYLVRAYALLLSAGVQRIYWYDYSDDPGLSTMGLTDTTGTPRLSGFAFQNASQELKNAAFSQREATASNVYSILFNRPDGTPVRVMWSLAPVSFAASGITRMVDLTGTAIPVTGTVSLSESPIFVEGPLAGLPSASGEVLLADSERDFSGTQGLNGWSYGAYPTGSNFQSLPTFSDQQWSGPYSYGTVTYADQHPSVNGSTPIPIVRRWISSYAGNLHITGNFQAENAGAGGDGVGVTVLVDGKPATVRTLIGSSATALQANFDLVITAQVGTTIDFAVDPGPAADMNYDATAMEATISTSQQTGSFAPDAGTYVVGQAPLDSPTTVTNVATALGSSGSSSPGSTGGAGSSGSGTSGATSTGSSAPAAGTVLADSSADFSGTQGQNGWAYGDFASGTSFEQLTTYASGTWGSQYPYISITQGDQHPSVWNNAPVSVVRRWVSTFAGTVQIAGSFQMENTGGDGVGVAVLVNGQPAVARTVLGASASSPTQQTFSLTQAVQVGSTIDFVVDPGPGADINYDATSVSATVTVVAAASGGSSTTTGTTSPGSTSSGSTSTPGSGGSSSTTTGTTSSSPSAAVGTVLADSTADFSGTQGQSGWWYGDYSAGTTLGQATTYANGSWGSPAPYLSLTQGDQHPSVWNSAPVSAVRRWVSTFAGTVQITGSFQMENTGGDGVGVAILVDGQPALARTLLGTAGGMPTQQAFNLTQTVAVGSTIDFVVDPGPGTNINFDATAVAATITVAGSSDSAGAGSTSSASGSTSPGSGTTSSGSGSTTPTGTTGTTTGTTGAGSTASGSTDMNSSASVQANSGADYGSAQGQNGWSYGYFSEAPGAIGPAVGDVFLPLTAAGATWTGPYTSLAITAATQAPAAVNGFTQISAVRRWTSAYAGNVHVTGSFQIGHDGDGVGVTVMVNGQPVAARVIIGNSGAAEVQNFDFVQAVQPGATIDFVVDPGPGRDASDDTTTCSATITSTTSAATSDVGPGSSPSVGASSTGTTAPTSGTGDGSSTSPSTGGTTGSTSTTATGGSTAAVGANAVNDFALAQGQNGWSYGYFTGSPGAIGPAVGATLVPMTVSGSGWVGPFPSLAITATTLAPYAAGIVQQAAVRRWTSTVTGNVQVTGSFQIGHSGDGVGVTILVNGQPAVARRLIGEPGPNYTETFSFIQAVAPGTTIDFVVDPGPGRDYSNDSTTFSATITTAP